MPDSGHIQEQDAAFANRHGYSKHKPAKPLYTHKDAVTAMALFRAISFDRTIDLSESVKMRLLPSGHILGSAFVEIEKRGKKIIFSGDLGRPGSGTMIDPSPIQRADYLVLESTYGNRQHDETDPTMALATVIRETASRGGTFNSLQYTFPSPDFCLSTGAR